MQTTPEGQARRAVTKGVPRKRKRARKRASVGGGEDERESTGESLECLSASLLLLSFFPLLLFFFLGRSPTLRSPPRARGFRSARLHLQLTARARHGAGAATPRGARPGRRTWTRRGSAWFFEVGREGGKEVGLRWERILTTTGRGFFYYLFFLRVIGETNHSFSSFSLLGERPFSRERAVSSSLCLLSRRERECDRGCCCSTSTRPRRRCRRRLQSSSSAAKHGQSPAPPSPLLFLQASRRAVAGLSPAAAIPAASPWPPLMRPLERSTRRLSGEGGIEVIER